MGKSNKEKIFPQPGKISSTLSCLLPQYIFVYPDIAMHAEKIFYFLHITEPGYMYGQSQIFHPVR
jgi:hypothetical protein